MNQKFSTNVQLLALSFSALISLSAQANDYLEEVVITASKVETPIREIGASVSVITSADIELKGYQSVADILRSQAGVTVSNSGGQGQPTAVRIRGEESYRTLFVIDGIDVSDPSLPQVAPQAEHIGATSDIERIEVLRGPQGFIYGADAGGVINIVTQSSQQGLNGALSLETGRYNSRKTNGFIAGANDTAGGFLSFSDSHTDGFDLSETKGIWPYESDGYENKTIHSKFHLKVSDSVTAQLVVRDTNATNQYDTCGYPVSSDQCSGDYSQTAGRLSVNYKNAEVQHSLSVQKNTTDRGYLIDGSTTYSAKGVAKKVEYLGERSLSSALSAVWGGDFETEDMTTGSTNNYQRDQSAVFGELRASIESSLYGSLGLRFDDSDDFGSHASARFSAAYIQSLANNGNLKYRASYGTGFRAPSLSEISYNDESFVEMEKLKEESSSGFDVGVDLLLGNDFIAQLTYFDQMIVNEIGFDLIAYTGYIQQKGKSHSKGLELNLEYSVCDHLSLFTNATYNRTLTREDKQRIRRPERSGNIGTRLSLASDKLNIIFAARFSGDAIDGASGQLKLKGYNVVDLSANYLLENNLTVYARVENIADKHYQEVTGYDAAEASVYVGARATF